MLLYSANKIPALVELPETNFSLDEVTLWILLIRDPINHPEMSKSFFILGLWLRQVMWTLRAEEHALNTFNRS